MPIFGDYETTQELYRHGLGVIFRAKHFASARPSLEKQERPANANGGYCVKVHQPVTGIARPQVLRAAAESFLQAARVQQSVVDAGGRYWAPIYDASFATNDAAYYVTTCYPRSAQKLIGSRVRLSASALYHIVDSVLKALIELKQTSGRTHGGLKPSNVLIGDGDIEHAKIVLTDPAPDDQTENDEADRDTFETADLAALGALIYQLVLHRPFHGAQSWPVAPSSEWRWLGEKANGWRDLCNRLTKPEKTETIHLGAVEQQLQALRAGRSAVTPRRLGAVGAVLLAGGLAACALAYPRYSRAWKEFCVADDEWLNQFRHDLASDPQRLTRIEQEPSLRKAAEEVLAAGDELDPKRVSGNETMMISELASHPPLTIGAFRKTPPALEVIHDVENAVSADRWPLLQKATRYQKFYTDRGWYAAADYLARFTDGVGLHRNLAAGIDKLLWAQPKLEDNFVFIEDSWQAVSDTQDLIAKTAANDKVLKQFNGFAQKYASARIAPPGQECTDLGNLRQGLLPLKDLANQLHEVLASDWPTRINQERLADEAQVYKISAPLQAADFQQWLREAQDYYIYQPDDVAGKVAALNSTADATAAKIKALPEKIPDYSGKIKALQDRLAGARGQIVQFSNQHWVQKDRRNGVIAANAASLSSQIRSIGQDADRIIAENTPDQKKWWDTFVLTSPAADKSVINDAWIKWCRKLPATRDQLNLEMSEFNKLRDLAQEWKAALIEVDKLFPPPPAVEEPYDSIAREKRRNDLQATLDAADTSGPAPNLERMKSEAAVRAGEYVKWCADLPPFLEDIHESRALLDLGYGLEDSQAARLSKLVDWKSHSVWTDLSTQGEVARVEQRFSALESLSQASRKQLADINASKGAPPELALAAWKKLGKLQNPAWPATPDELRQEKVIYLNVVSSFSQFSDRIRADQLSKALADEDFRRLVVFLNSPRNPAQMEAALAAAIGTWPGSPDFDSLPLNPIPHYNALLYGLRANLARITKPAQSPRPEDRVTILKFCDAFRQGVARLPADLQSEPDVASLVRQLAALKEPEPPHGPPAPWKSEALADGVMTFTAASAGGTPLVLRFARVDVSDSQAVYLCTTELSFADFLAIVPDALLTRTNRGQLLLDYRDNADPRLGPRVWEWPSADSSVAVGLIQPDSWLRPHDDDFWDFPVEFRDRQSQFNRFSLDANAGGNPLHRPRLPMNYLPAPTAMYVADLVGCRLPTSAEWSAAYARTAKRGHFRGTAWRAQQQYILAQKGQPQWPDSGIFWPADYHGKHRTGAPAESYNLTDSALFFREVDADSGPTESVFHNLSGNIAEFVWEDPGKFEHLPDHSLPALKTFLEQNPDQLFVIGGSALSPPELPVDTRLPVDLHKGSSTPNAWEGFADVGMRLAFDATLPPGQRLAKILESHPYLSTAQAKDGNSPNRQ